MQRDDPESGYRENPVPLDPYVQKALDRSIQNEMLAALRVASIAFRQYEQTHLAKGTPDADAKAHRNHELAAVMDAAIARVST